MTPLQRVRTAGRRIGLVLLVVLVGGSILLFNSASRWFDRQANRNRLFRRLLIVWSCGLITWVVYQTFTDAPDIPGSTAAALATVLGLLTVVIGFYQWSRASEDAREQQQREERKS